jgi:hypothetical protein
MKLEWEEIFIQNEYKRMQVGTWRSKVLGGWIVSNTVAMHNTPATALCFVPDVEHIWEVKE